MRKVYLLVYSSSLGNREEVRACIKSLPEIITWRYDMPNTFYMVSEFEAQDISDAIRKYFTGKGRFLVTEVTENRQGLLLKKTWYFIKNKKVIANNGIN